MHPRKRIRPQAPGWGKGWSVIGGDAVDYEASLDFDRVILGGSRPKGSSPKAAHASPCGRNPSPAPQADLEEPEKSHLETVARLRKDGKETGA
jgi:hypothetical protein